MKIALALLLALVLAGCSAQPVAREATPAAREATPPAADPAVEAAAADPAASREGAGTLRSISGKVVETMNAANYTYVLVDTGSEKIWAASSTFPVEVGDNVVVPLETPMSNFHSETLNRDFPLIYFASAVSREGEVAPAVSPHGNAPAGQPPMMRSSNHPPISHAQAVIEKVAAAPGGTSVADIWANRKALGGRSVTVRGKVVRFNGGILGRNWVHLQDGTGTADASTNDILVTTTDTVKVGDIVTATGTVQLDKDFGAGYTYAVLIENATFKAK